MTWPFGDLERGKYGAILADPPWRFDVWSGETAVKKRPNTKTHGTSTSSAVHYATMPMDEIAGLPVPELCAKDCALFMWVTWPTLLDGLRIMDAWSFPYKTCAFNWMKGHAGQIELFAEEIIPLMKMGYWTRASSEVCLLGTRGKPKRLNADVRQGIIAPVRQHSRKPDGIHARIERLVSGPYCELFARQKRPGWDVWGNQTDKFQSPTVAQEAHAVSEATNRQQIAEIARAATPVDPAPSSTALLARLRGKMRPMNIPKLNAEEFE